MKGVSAAFGSRQPTWARIVPILAVALLIVAWGRSLPFWAVAVIALTLAGAVLSAVYHADVVARRVGEPFGSVVLAVSVTVIEVGLIVTLMLSGGPQTTSLARDTVFAVVMLTANGILGLSLLVGSLREGVALFNPEGTGGAFATVLTLATLSLVIPTFATGRPGAVFSPPQLFFAATASLLLYVLFVTMQTRRHRESFLPITAAGDVVEFEQIETPRMSTTWASTGLLLLALVAVVGNAKVISPSVEAGVAEVGLPQEIVGVIIAMLILLPETLAALRAVRRDRVQTGLNLALGSAIASIGLTIPAIAVASIWLDGPLTLGLGGIKLVLLAITAVVGVLTIVPGRATPLQGGVHLAILAAYLFLAASP